MNVTSAQQKLNTAGYSVNVDGDLGPKTLAAILDYITGHKLGDLGIKLARGMSAAFATYEINTVLRLAHFVAQAAHETGGFKYLTELGGDSYFKKYDGRADLGNNVPGDGAKYKGRGLFQITGRANYTTYGDALHLDLVSNPNRAAEPEVAVATACLYWQKRKLNPLADADNVREITHRINGGYNGLSDRQEYLTKLKNLLA